MSLDAANVQELPPKFAGMDFMQFLAWSQQASRAFPDLKRLCETRIARAFEPIRPTVEVPTTFPTAHRCNLARRWCEVRGLPSRMAKNALICEGVRHGLGLIFKLLAKAGKRVAVPRDVYPVYWSLAEEAGVLAIGIETFPIFDVDAILENASAAGASVVLVPAPLKLQGRRWTSNEVDCAITWLSRDSRRRLIVDGVYSFGLPTDPLINRLLETGQVNYLDSLSKGWLHEMVLGVAIVPESDFGMYAGTFRGLTLCQQKLFCAGELLARFHHFPVQLTKEINRRRDVIWKLIETTGLKTLPATQGYLVPIHGGAPSLVAEHGLLTIPASVFGSSLLEWSVASALTAGERL